MTSSGIGFVLQKFLHWHVIVMNEEDSNIFILYNTQEHFKLLSHPGLSFGHPKSCHSYSFCAVEALEL